VQEEPVLAIDIRPCLVAYALFLLFRLVWLRSTLFDNFATRNRQHRECKDEAAYFGGTPDNDAPFGGRPIDRMHPINRAMPASRATIVLRCFVDVDACGIVSQYLGPRIHDNKTVPVRS
jgi:hypothetical protein